MLRWCISSPLCLQEQYQNQTQSVALMFNHGSETLECDIIKLNTYSIEQLEYRFGLKHV